MKRTASVLIALLIVPGLAVAQARNQANAGAKYINYKYKGVNPESRLPNGVKHLGGALIGDVEADPVYAISHVTVGKTTMLWLDVSTGRDARGVTGWRVLDVVVFPLVTKSDHVFFHGDPAIECKRAGKEVPNLVGIGKIVPRQDVFKPAKVWIANPRTKKFVPTTVAGLKCIYSEP